ncbi:MAG: hypothetical protein A2033_04115 [Bacteroidetes bacterium GWA2_31_9]|nr:MAG: hypothetical protein A2033_04115 [Bacteroidetes bacterium GWA2_31_9]
MELQYNLEYKQILNLIMQLSDNEKVKILKKINENLSTKKPKPIMREFGCMKGVVKYMADDFDAPLNDFKEYMP